MCDLNFFNERAEKVKFSLDEAQDLITNVLHNLVVQVFTPMGQLTGIFLSADIVLTSGHVFAQVDKSLVKIRHEFCNYSHVRIERKKTRNALTLRNECVFYLSIRFFYVIHVKFLHW